MPFSYSYSMTKKDFFIIIIRLFGLYLLIGVLFNSISISLPYILNSSDVISYVIVLISTLIPLALFILLIFKAENIINLLKLDKGFDEERIDFGNIEAIHILKIAVFILGGIILVDNIPIFINHIVNSLESRINSDNMNSYPKYYWIASFIKIIIGYLFVTYFDIISQKLLKNNSED